MLPLQQQNAQKQGNSAGNVNLFNNNGQRSFQQTRSYNNGFVNNKNSSGNYRSRCFDDQNVGNGQWASTSSNRHNNNVVGNGGSRSHRSYNKNHNNRSNSDYWHKTLNYSGNISNNNQQQADLTQQHQSFHTRKNDENGERYPRAFYQRVSIKNYFLINFF